MNNLIEERRLPSCVDIGLEASKRGDFKLARQMLRTAMQNLTDQSDSQSGLIELMTHISDTYLNEGNYELAEGWYLKALHRSELDQGKSNLQAVFVLARLAQVHVLNSNQNEFRNYLEQLERTYLLIEQKNLSALLSPLIDLSWAICIKGHLTYLRPINEIITQIMELDAEDNAAFIA